MEEDLLGIMQFIARNNECNFHPVRKEVSLKIYPDLKESEYQMSDVLALSYKVTLWDMNAKQKRIHYSCLNLKEVELVINGILMVVEQLREAQDAQK